MIAKSITMDSNWAGELVVCKATKSGYTHLEVGRLYDVIVISDYNETYRNNFYLQMNRIWQEKGGSFKNQKWVNVLKEDVSDLFVTPEEWRDIKIGKLGI